MSKAEIIRKLSEKLKKKPFEMKEFLCDLNKRCCFIGSGKKIRIKNHFDPKTDMMIQDCFLNTLGLVYIYCNPDDEGKNNSCSDFLESCIDESSYIRHLLIRDAEAKFKENGKGKEVIQPWSVELILLCPANKQKEFGETLKKISRETSYLYSIGVNLLPYSKKYLKRKDVYQFKEKDINRAFCWLLQKARKWYKNDVHHDVKNNLKKITLENYRLPGQREMELKSDTNVHLFHGLNGSGKSSIVEALEIIVTGKSERLERTKDYSKSQIEKAKDYFSIIKNKNSDAKLINITLELEKSAIEYAITNNTQAEPAKPLNEKLKAASFILNQEIMDQLTRDGDTKRAQIFIEAFFPKDREIVEKHNSAEKEASENFKKLPKAIIERVKNQANRESGLSEILKQLEEGGENPVELKEAWLPVSIDLLGKLSLFFKDLETPVNSLKSIAPIREETLNEIDNRLKEIFKNPEQKLTDLRQTLNLLNGLNQWYVSSDSEIDYQETLDLWLETAVLVDLSEKYYAVVHSFQNSVAEGWKIPEDIRQIFGENIFETDTGPIDTGIIRDKIDELILKRDNLRKRLELTVEERKIKENESISNIPIIRIPNPKEISQLNELGKLLSCHGLGTEIKESVTANKISKFNTNITIGIQHWADSLIKETQNLIGVYEEIKKNVNASEETCVQRFQNLKTTIQKYKELNELSIEVEKTFIKLLKSKEDGSLIKVLNELIYLFTPARWAYDEISIRHEYSNTDKEHKVQLGFIDNREPNKKGQEAKDQKPKARADLRLNTAELNLFAFSLFILCSMRVENPISTLVFDDPLQNMDELTVTTLVRGIGKLVKLFHENQNYQLLMFFHGREDLERFCNEIPSAVYFLPWLGPLNEEKTQDPILISCDDKYDFISKNQDLTEIIEFID
ncbi:MAG: ATP-binding protein [Candidatus Omnitrophota bacterium]